MSTHYEALAELVSIREQIDALIEQRGLLVKVASQHGARQTDLAFATGLSRPTINKMVGGRIGHSR